MTLRSYTRIELAESQLKTAVILFVSKRDMFSVITLAGAADVIFAQLVEDLGQQTFTEHMLEFESPTDPPITKGRLGKEINDTLHINDLKHLDDGDDGYINLDPEECAIGAILKAIANYSLLGGRKKDFVLAFMEWVRTNLDPKKYNVNADPNWADGSTTDED